MSLKVGVAVTITKVERQDGYCLELTFSDGHVSVVEFGTFLRGSQNPETRQFLNVKRFRDFSLRHGNLVWGDYEMCFPIEDMYEGKIASAKPVGDVLAVAESRTEYSGKKKKTRPREERGKVVSYAGSGTRSGCRCLKTTLSV